MELAFSMVTQHKAYSDWSGILFLLEDLSYKHYHATNTNTFVIPWPTLLKLLNPKGESSGTVMIHCYLHLVRTSTRGITHNLPPSSLPIDLPGKLMDNSKRIVTTDPRRMHTLNVTSPLQAVFHILTFLNIAFC